MRTLALLLLLAAAARPAEPSISAAEIANLTTSTTSLSEISALRGPSHLFFASGLKIDLETGAVDLPKSLSLSETARSFWVALADAYPNVRYELMHPPISVKEPPNSGVFTVASPPEVGRIEFGSLDSSRIRIIYRGGEVLSVAGLPRAKDEVPKYSVIPFARPESAASVSVELTTRDGRVWTAKWEEKR